MTLDWKYDLPKKPQFMDPPVAARLPVQRRLEHPGYTPSNSLTNPVHMPGRVILPPNIYYQNSALISLDRSTIRTMESNTSAGDDRGFDILPTITEASPVSSDPPRSFDFV